jgi:hypothetical protein
MKSEGRGGKLKADLSSFLSIRLVWPITPLVVLAPKNWGNIRRKMQETDQEREKEGVGATREEKGKGPRKVVRSMGDDQKRGRTELSVPNKTKYMENRVENEKRSVGKGRGK